MDKRPLCYAPFIGMYVSEFGYSPCCVFKGNISASSPEEYWNSKELSNIRKQMYSGSLPAGCQVCKKNIDAGIDSDLKFWDYNYLQSPHQPEEYAHPIVIDFRPGNHCNLKCRMCGPASSDQIEKENNNHKQLLRFYSKHGTKFFDINQCLDYVKNKKFVKIKVLGGEPSIDKNVVSFLEALSPDLRLEITTNATSTNKRFMEAIKNFNDLHLTFSVDAVGKTYEYIRTNASWNIVSENIDKMFSAGVAKTYKFNVVLMPYNIFNLTDLMLWFRQLRAKGYNFNVWYTDSDSPKTSLSNVKDIHKEQAINELFALKDPEAHNLIEVLSSIDYIDSDKFISFNNTLDDVRKTRLTDIDIRFKDYI